jgi:hypothetical protein
VSITQPECVFVALAIQHAMRMCHIVICGLPGSIIFFHLNHKRHDFRKKKSRNTEYAFWFSLQLLSETFFIVRRNKRDMIENVRYIGILVFT